MNKQSFPRHSLTRGATVATRLLAARGIAQHILDATIEDLECVKPIQRCRAEQGFVLGRGVVLPGQVFWLVASKFAHRFYMVVRHGEDYQCSSRDEEVARQCIERVELYRRGRAKQAA